MMSKSKSGGPEIRALKHGRATSPVTRGAQLIKLGLIGEWQDDVLESGKDFPLYDATDLFLGYEGDVPSVKPPRDGYILSGDHDESEVLDNGEKDNRWMLNFTDAEFTAKVKEIKPDSEVDGWELIDVQPHGKFEVTWKYTAAHTTRGYRWFITKDGWNQGERISRSQLDEAYFHEEFSSLQPYSEHNHELEAWSPVSAKLPDKEGRHVIILLWVVANTGNAFYQTFDVRFPDK